MYEPDIGKVLEVDDQMRGQPCRETKIEKHSIDGSGGNGSVDCGESVLEDPTV
jgi:hypothetical protein